MTTNCTELYAGKVVRLCREAHTHTLPLAEAVAMAGDGRIDDAKTQLALLLYAQQSGSRR